jgi:hypothetical protein
MHPHVHLAVVSARHAGDESAHGRMGAGLGAKGARVDRVEPRSAGKQARESGNEGCESEPGERRPPA